MQGRCFSVTMRAPGDDIDWCWGSSSPHDLTVDDTTLLMAQVLALPDALRSRQRAFDRTGDPPTNG